MSKASNPNDVSKLYCGPPSLPLGSLYHRDPSGGIGALFKGRSAHMAYNTRVAIHVGCSLLGLHAGDEVLVPAYNCGSELDPLHALGLSLKLYPVGSDLLADPDRIAPLITENTRAIYVTHYFGLLQAKMDALRELCDRHGLRLIEDCALSLLSGEQLVAGNHGDIAVFCFHKFLPTPEGGALVINARDLDKSDPFTSPAPTKKTVKAAVRTAAQLAFGPARFDRIMRERRLKRSSDTEGQGATPTTADIPHHYYFDPSLAGRRMDRMTSMALRSFSVDEVISKRRANWQKLSERIADIPGASAVLSEMPKHICPQNFPVYVNNRDEVARRLQAEGIAATPWWAGYSRHLDWTGQDEAVLLKETILGLPVHQTLTPKHQDYIADVLNDVLVKLG